MLGEDPGFLGEGEEEIRGEGAWPGRARGLGRDEMAVCLEGLDCSGPFKTDLRCRLGGRPSMMGGAEAKMGMRVR